MRESIILFASTTAVSANWKLQQLNVNNAFLHSILKEMVYRWNDNPRLSNHACKLKKSLYRLKQILPAWFNRTSTFLIQTGFVRSRGNSSFIIYLKKGYQYAHANSCL